MENSGKDKKENRDSTSSRWSEAGVEAGGELNIKNNSTCFISFSSFRICPFRM